MSNLDGASIEAGANYSYLSATSGSIRSAPPRGKFLRGGDAAD
jgi:hypothetical protein